MESKDTVPSIKDIKWARRHGWDWDGEKFYPIPVVTVIPNPLGKHWCPHLAPIGVLQHDAPFANVRAAIRVAESIRLQRPLQDGEMDCSKD